MKIMVIINKVILFAVSAGLLSVLSACSSKNAPDEYMVLKNAPLSLPAK